MKDDIVIVSAARTPVGAFNGAFANLPAHELGKAAIKAAMERAGVEGAQVNEVIMGQILTAGQGQNPARQASIAAGIPVESPAWGVNQLCGSGLRAVALGYAADRQWRRRHRGGRRPGIDEHGAARPASAPGREDGRVRNGRHHDQGRAVGRLQRLPHGQHRRERRQAMADHPRSMQDEFAVASQNKAEAAQKAGKFKDEIVPVTIKSRKGDVVVRRRRISQARRHAGRPRQAAPRLRQRKAR